MNNHYKKNTLFFFILILLLNSFANTAPCSNRQSIDYQKPIKKSRQLVNEFINHQHIVGLTIAISVCDTIIWSEGFGVADLEHNVPVTTKTKFRIGSVSKTLTAALMSVLYEQGKLKLDAPVQRYVPSFPPKTFPMTVQQVAGHLAGIRHYKGDEFFISKYYPTVLEGLDIFKHDPLLSKPGEKFLYSSHGWNLLSAVVESASGKPYLLAMQENIFTPLRMLATSADMNTQIIANRTRFYHVTDQGKVSHAPYVDNSYKWASGGFIANAEDLIRFGNAMLYNRLVTQKTFALFSTTMQTKNGQKTHYGLGWDTNLLNKNSTSLKKLYGEKAAKAIHNVLQDQQLLGHSGGSVGGKTLFWILPKTGISIAAMSNSNIPPVVAFNVTAEFVKQLKK